MAKITFFDQKLFGKAKKSLHNSWNGFSTLILGNIYENFDQ